ETRITFAGLHRGKGALRFPSRFQKVGATLFQYVGPLTYEWTQSIAAGKPARISQHAAQASVSLQWDPYESTWDLKVLLAYELKPEEIETSVLVTPEQINVEAIYLPLLP